MTGITAGLTAADAANSPLGTFLPADTVAARAGAMAGASRDAHP